MAPAAATVDRLPMVAAIPEVAKPIVLRQDLPVSIFCRVDLIDQLQTLATRAEQTGDSLTNEEATKMALIAPFIQALGYDIFNPTEVKPEFAADFQDVKQGERVDYAVLDRETGIPKILIEAKPFNTDLSHANKKQLSRYFSVTHARIGILTNGRIFQFFSDLDKPNLMDPRPFAELDLSDLRSAPIEQLKQMSKSMFDLDLLLSGAERLKYLRAVKERIRQELTDPGEWLVRELIRDVVDAKRISGQQIDKLKPVVIDAIKSYINDRINERLHSAMEVEQASKPAEEVVQEPEPEEVAGAVFTEDEREGLYIIRAICATDVEPQRLSEKDTKSYCNVLLDGNSWKSVVRMYFNGSQKKLEVFDDQEPRMVALDGVNDIYKHSDRIRAALRQRMA
jgi:predicted type IV restriction endonuclease